MLNPERCPRPAGAARGAAAAALLALVAAVAACGDGESAAAPRATEESRLPAAPRDSSEAAVALRAALDEGRADRAEELLAALAERLGAEEGCLRARLAFLRGDDQGWLRGVEDARAAAPRDPRPYATAAELWAAAGELDAARDELRRGVEALGGLTPELERAKGVLAIVTPGGGRVGLDHLQRALARDADLPFAARPLGQAHLLMAKAAMSRHDLPSALESIEASLRADPLDMDARDFHAQALYANERFEDAIVGYEALFAEGLERVGPELAKWHKNVGLLAQVAGDEEAAARHYLRARELGMPEHLLATGANFLRDRARDAVRRAVERYEAGELLAAEEELAESRRLSPDARRVRREVADALAEDAVRALVESDVPDPVEAKRCLRLARWCDAEAELVRQVDEEMARRARVEEAEARVAEAADALREGDGVTADVALARALELDPENRLGRVLRGKLHFARKEWSAAAADFRQVVDIARADGVELPEPIHLHLAACLDVAGDREGARDVLREYLSERPEGTWLEETRERLRLLE